MDGGGGGDAFSSSTAPLTWHDFLERMRHPSAADFVKSIKSFIMSFTNKPPDPEKDSAAFQEFLTNMEGAFRAHSLWAGCSDEELESAGEGLEKYVMTKLFSRAFAPTTEEKKHDEALYEKMTLIQQFIRPEHLDIKPTFQNETSWLLAQKELQKINMYKAPRDKLVCILNCCKVINNLLLNASLASSENPPGADEFLPVLIYVTIKANPPQLHSNLLYIQRYRRQSRLVSEAAYYFTNIFSAESFIWNIDAKSISMDEVEFQKNMESGRVLLAGLSTDGEIPATGSTHGTRPFSPPDIQDHRLERKKPEELSGKPTIGHHNQPQPSELGKEHPGKDLLNSSKPSILDLETKGASNLLREDQVSRYFSEYPFLYTSAGDLTVNDVGALLHSYKQLVLKYVSLSKGMGIVNPSFPSPLTEDSRAYSDAAEMGKDNEKLDDATQMGKDSEKLDDATEMRKGNEKFEEFIEAVENSIGSTSDEAGGISFNIPAVEPTKDSSSEKAEISS